MNITPQLILGIIIAGIFCFFILERIIPKRQPKEKTFICTRCKSLSPHTQRTIKAWCNDKRTFFCQTCHFKWVQSRPSQKRERKSYSGVSGSRSGCLGVILLFAIIPIAGYLLLRMYT